MLKERLEMSSGRCRDSKNHGSRKKQMVSEDVTVETVTVEGAER